ncbi:MAG: bifunctional phosphopantothenoylcysteine decarboxylase/phosphopantothenate--cysteine ligase CoaBC, partial [Bacteroidetes bacterium]|nr:bifunctional phosphopantothenoylcysteine decarboxylase/phosphopantothenate--cysteine ligase CoaBC [Bacteroidota bacterium]
HPATQANLKTLESYGNHIIEPATGELASGLEGKGRMEEPEKIVTWLEGFLKKKQRFTGKKVLITAGPTFEKIDPVRFIGNYSSGKMGLALAEALVEEGADVSLILGPNLEVGNPRLHRVRRESGIGNRQAEIGRISLIHVVSGEEMYKEAHEIYPDMDVSIMAAAVADFKPLDPKESKIKGKEKGFSIDLVPNPDIAKELGKLKRADQLNIGFALETDEGLESALAKKHRKNFDLIVLNSLQDQGAGFGGDTNQITLIAKDNKPRKFELKSKKDVAKDILDEIVRIGNQDQKLFP